MHAIRFSLLLTGLACTSAVGAEPAALAGGFAVVQQQVVEHTLSNGLRLILLPRHEAPVFSFATVADVGSVDEHVGITGLAHMFEHMAFKGTSRIGTKDWPAEQKAMAAADVAAEALRSARLHGASADQLKPLEDEFKRADAAAQAFVVSNEYSSILERAGANDLNAYTAADQTVYYYSLPSNKLELWMSLESDRYLDPVLREFYKERDVVKEERYMRIDSSPFGRLLEEFLGMAFVYHPYGSEGIGTQSDLDMFTRAQAVEFYRTHYVPANLIISVVGDIDPAKTIAMAEKYFGRIPARPAAEPVSTVEPPQDSERRSTMVAQSQPIVLVGYHKPSANGPDEAAYDALESIISDGRTSRLYRSLIQEQKIAVQADGFNDFPGRKYPTMFCFYALAAPGHSNEQVLAAMDIEIERLKNEPVSADELARVKAKAKAAMVEQLESNLGMALQLSTQEGLSGNWRDVFRQIDRINALTVADIQRVARATFRRSNRTIAMVEPEPAPAAGARP